MTYLLDTNVVSEFYRRAEHSPAVQWASGVEEEDQFVSSVTIGELIRGAARLPIAKRRSDILRWVEKDLVERLAERILAFDADVAAYWGYLRAEIERRGRPLPTLDSQIAATAIFRGMMLVTRNVSDFADIGITVLNPWSEA